MLWLSSNLLLDQVTTGDLTRKPNSGHHCDKSLMAEVSGGRFKRIYLRKIYLHDIHFQEDTSHSSSDPQIGEIDRDRLALFRSKFKTQVHQNVLNSLKEGKM